jgi:hypothetical protein
MTVFTKGSDIAAYLTTVLAGITKANGYNTDIGLRVFPWSSQDRRAPTALRSDHRG